ncbi:hypothetical protein F3D3_0009 [Fusibacter sp. 3D3]|nr:hypothetical protein F3D3_0009 [Fusibacter sp. 3D3]
MFFVCAVGGLYPFIITTAVSKPKHLLQKVQNLFAINLLNKIEK